MENINTVNEFKTELQTIMQKATDMGKECHDPVTKAIHETSADVLQCLVSAYAQLEEVVNVK